MGGQGSAGDADFGRELIVLLDSDVVMLQRMLDRIGVMNKAMLFEFKRTQNMQMLPALKSAEEKTNTLAVHQRESSRDLVAKPDDSRCSRWISWCCCKATDDSAHLVDDAEQGAFHLDPRFASGEIFTPHCLGA